MAGFAVRDAARENDDEVGDALVPARAVARSFAELVERVGDHELRAVTERLQLEAQDVGAPAHFEESLLFELEHFAVEGEVVGVGDEAQLAMWFDRAFDAVREPRIEMLGISQCTPHLLW